MSEAMLVAVAQCNICGSKDTRFERFRGKLICPDKSKPAKAVRILAEVHHCESCNTFFERRDGPWVGLELAAWGEAMRQGLDFAKVDEYTNWIRNGCKRV